MESLSGIDFFVRAAEARSFSEAGRVLGVSSSAVGKSVARLEQRLGVRLFHRSTRSITLTAEGALFLERCRRILCEIEAAELELSETRKAPRGRLRVSLPLVAGLVMPTLIAFMRRYPSIELDLDFSDRLVDIVEEGFDAVIRTGEPNDSRLMSRPLGTFKLLVVGSPRYFAEHGRPQVPADLLQHVCLLYRFPSSGRLQVWPVAGEGEADLTLPAALICNTTEALLHVVRDALGIACVPDLTVRDALAAGELVTVLDDFNQHQNTFRMLWPSSKHLAPKLRVFIDFMCTELFKR
ncbi:LysR family transcriptional regulator [Pseudomonas sp. Z4-20]|uniref:LysR family transcriptional regulator n=1 Tax=Pseudomonas sp. Z4-20 TaxID=2817414 RepID=UPI003DA92C6C